MTYTPRPVWLDCAHPGCPRGTFADPRHLSNLLASGGHYCHTHDRDDLEETA